MNTVHIRIILSTMLFTFGLAKEKGAPPMMTGATGELTCAKSRCHTSYELNSGPGKIEVLGFPEKYVPGEIYTLTIRGQQPKIKRWGFEITLVDSSNKPGGSIVPVETKTTQLIDPRKYAGRSDLQYITHTKAGIDSPKKGESPNWEIQWTAPEIADSPVNLFLAVNATNADGEKFDDYIYTLHRVSEPALADSSKP